MNVRTYKEIYGVLDHGRVLNGHRWRFLLFTVCFPLVFPLITLGVAITVWAGEMSWDSEVIGGLIGVNGLGLCMFGVFLYILLTNIKYRKNVAIWLEDAVEVDAIIQRLDWCGRISVPEQMEVLFVLDGKQIHIKSTYESSEKYKNRIFLKYVNKNIKLMYSPKYERVLFPLPDKMQ